MIGRIESWVHAPILPSSHLILSRQRHRKSAQFSVRVSKWTEVANDTP